jgi:hypothetical protein
MRRLADLHIRALHTEALAGRLDARRLLSHA